MSEFNKQHLKFLFGVALGSWTISVIIIFPFVQNNPSLLTYTLIPALCVPLCIHALLRMGHVDVVVKLLNFAISVGEIFAFVGMYIIFGGFVVASILFTRKVGAYGLILVAFAVASFLCVPVPHTINMIRCIKYERSCKENTCI